MPNLTRLKKNHLTWSTAFVGIARYALTGSDTTTNIFDEVQWMEKKGVGFVSRLKEAWVGWEQSQKPKVIIAGLLNKVFAKVKAQK